MNIVSYEPATETLYIDRRQFDVLHLRSSSKPKVLASIQIAMQELHGKAVPPGAREVYRDTTIAIVPRMNLRDASPASIIKLPAASRLSVTRSSAMAIYTVEVPDPAWLRGIEAIFRFISFGRWFNGR